MGYVWMDRVSWLSRRAVADVLGLIGRNWLSCLGWSLFVMAISEPARAQDMGQDACLNRQQWLEACQNEICGGSPPCAASPNITAVECRAEALTANGSSLRIMQRYTYDSNGTPVTGSWQVFGQTTCPGCDTLPPESASEHDTEFWNWPGDASHTECFGGCEYAPAPVGPGPNGTVCGLTEIEFNGDTQTGSVSCAAEVIAPTGAACNPVEGAPENPAELPPPDPPCVTAGDGSQFCAEVQQACVTVGAEVVCIPLEAMPTTQMVPPPPDDGVDVAAGQEPPPMPSDPSEPPKHSATASTTVDGVTSTYVVNWSPSGWNPDAGPTDVDDLRDAPPDQDGDGIPDDHDDDADGDGVPDGVPTGDPDGDCNPETGEGCEHGEAEGGLDCDVQPQCSGDAIVCMVAFQTWKTRCGVAQLRSQFFGDDESPVPIDPDVPVALWDVEGSVPLPSLSQLDANGGLVASCDVVSVQVLDTQWSIDICPWLNIVGVLVMAAAYFMAARILLSK